jgi:hydroxyacylglutathione hydrolase
MSEDTMEYLALPTGEIQANCCIIWGSERKAVILDPGAEPERILDALKERNLEVAAYMMTHGHMDHIGALGDLYAARPAPVGLHPDDRIWAFTRVNQYPPFYPVPRKPAAIERNLADGQEWRDADLAYRCIATPGHTPGSVCFFFPEVRVLFTGDTLFADSVGRTDLPGGDSRILKESLRKLAALPDDTTVVPGHGPQTDLGAEKEHNYFLQFART